MIFLILISVSCVNASQINESNAIYSLESGNDFSALNNIINASSQTKSLNLTKDYAYDSNRDTDLSDGITIAIDDLIIDGKGHTINANNHARVFNIQSKNVVLKNIIIINADHDSSGGAVYWSGSDGKIIDCSFKDCISHNSGGAAYLKNSINVINSTFIGNSANFAGAIDFESDSTVENCKFEQNFATYLGGAVYSMEKTSFYNSKFNQNKAGDGGGIYFFMKGSVENSIFENNIAIGYGGAIVNDDSVTVNNSAFIKNTGFVEGGAIFLKGNGAIDNSTFTGNSANKTGGAIYAYCDNIVISDCEFNNNTADEGNSIKVTNNKNIKIENSVFNNNPSTYESEIKIESSNTTLTNLSYNNITKKETTPSKTVVTKKKTSLTAKTKTFKLKTKTKKYSVKLKAGKTLLKNKKIKLTVKGKTYFAKTNKKGLATFKLKITKKGKFKAIIRFYGDKLYKSSKKTVYIKIKK